MCHSARFLMCQVIREHTNEQWYHKMDSFKKDNTTENQRTIRAREWQNIIDLSYEKVLTVQQHTAMLQAQQIPPKKPKELALQTTLSNSSIRQIPLSARTRAPASSVHSRETGLRWTYAVKPTADAPWPVVNTTRDAVFSTYLRNCDLAVPGSPQISTLMSPRTLCFPPDRCTMCTYTLNTCKLHAIADFNAVFVIVL